MRNLIRFLIRNNAFFLFIALEGLSLWFIYQNQAYHQVKISRATQRITGSVLESWHDITSYFALQRINDSLQKEMAKARSGQLPPAAEVQVATIDSVRDTVYRQLYRYLPVKVMSATIHHADNWMMINKGSREGIGEGMGVIGPNGIAGKVVSVSPHYARVMSILHRDFRAAVQLKRQGLRGVIKWAPFTPDVGKLEYITEPADLRVGDTVVTAGASTFFPEGILVGTITDFSLDPGENFYDISVKLSTRLDGLRYGYVVVDIDRMEKRQLQDSTDA